MSIPIENTFGGYSLPIHPEWSTLLVFVDGFDQAILELIGVFFLLLLKDKQRTPNRETEIITESHFQGSRTSFSNNGRIGSLTLPLILERANGVQDARSRNLIGFSSNRLSSHLCRSKLVWQVASQPVSHQSTASAAAAAATTPREDEDQESSFPAVHPLRPLEVKGSSTNHPNKRKQRDIPEVPYRRKARQCGMQKARRYPSGRVHCHTHTHTRVRPRGVTAFLRHQYIRQDCTRAAQGMGLT